MSGRQTSLDSAGCDIDLMLEKAINTAVDAGQGICQKDVRILDRPNVKWKSCFGLLKNTIS